MRVCGTGFPKLCWFALASLFNVISTFRGYLMPKPSLLKNRRGTI